MQWDEADLISCILFGQHPSLDECCVTKSSSAPSNKSGDSITRQTLVIISSHEDERHYGVLLAIWSDDLLVRYDVYREKQRLVPPINPHTEDNFLFLIQETSHPSETGYRHVKQFFPEIYTQVRNLSNDRNAKHYRRKRKSSAKRWKRQNEFKPLKFLPPFKLVLSDIPKEISLKQLFQVTVTVRDQRENIVDDLRGDLKIRATISSFEPGTNSKDLLIGKLEVLVVKGVAVFDIAFTKLGTNFRVEFVGVPGSTQTDVHVTSAKTGYIRVMERPMTLRLTANSLPFDSVEGEVLNPAVGVVLVDQLTNYTAGHDTLGNYTWVATVRLKYGFYRGKLLGTQRVFLKGKNRVLFEDLAISSWGYKYVLVVDVTSEPKGKRNMSLEIGPFDVRQKLEEDVVRVTTDNFWFLNMELEGNFSAISDDITAFRIAFLNSFGTKYASVLWSTVREWSGSIHTLSRLSGRNHEINETVVKIQTDIDKGLLQLEMMDGRSFKVKRAAVASGDEASPTKAGMEDSSKKSKDGEGTLPLAWIAAIVINGILVFLFIVFVIYCYCRSRKRTPSNATTFEKRFEGEPDRMFADKAANHLPGNERAVANGQTGRENPVFTVENERTRMRDDAPDGYSSPVERPYSQPYGARPQSGPYSYPPLYIDDPPVPMVNRSTYTSDLDDDIEDIYQVGLREYNPSEEVPQDRPDSVHSQTEEEKAPEENEENEEEPVPQEDPEEKDPDPEPEPEPEPEPDEEEEEELDREVQEAEEAGEPDPVSRPTSGDISVDSYHPVDPMLLPAATAVVNIPGTPDSFTGADWQSPQRDPRMEENDDEPLLKTYEVYLHRKQQRKKEHIGSVVLPDNGTTTLAIVRDAIIQGDLNLNDDDKETCIFLTEKLDEVNGPEEALLADLIYPEQEIILRLSSDVTQSHRSPRVETTLPKASEFKRKELAYVGPLGMCNAPECEKAARVKCLDCGQVGYCSTRHMREDTPIHRRTCFKPAWKI